MDITLYRVGFSPKGVKRMVPRGRRLGQLSAPRHRTTKNILAEKSRMGRNAGGTGQETQRLNFF
jgi:hypothetical protein